MGTPADREAYAATLTAWLRERVADLPAEDRDKVESHPLRVLDSKRPATQALVADAPRMVDVLDAGSRAHFERVHAGLAALAIPFEIDTRLVRGHRLLHAHAVRVPERGAGNRTVDHHRRRALRRAGRAARWPADPGHRVRVGHRARAAGLRRRGRARGPDSALDVFVVDATDGAAARDLVHQLRLAGLRADRAFDGRSLKSQMKAAGRSGARVAVIIGERELADGTATVRDLGQSEQDVFRDPVVDRGPQADRDVRRMAIRRWHPHRRQSDPGDRHVLGVG